MYNALIIYLILGVFVASIQAVQTAKNSENRGALISSDSDERGIAWFILGLVWFINIFVWLPYMIFKHIVKPVVKKVV